MELTTEQQEAVRLYQTSGFLVVNGGPGTGKTTVIKQLFNVEPDNTLIMTPTGCAADRIWTATGIQAHTYKSVFYNEVSFDKYLGNNVIIDEGSMMSLESLNRVLKFLKPNRLCIVADPDQLRCIGETTVIRTLATLPGIPRVTLTINHRQQSRDSALFKTISALRDTSFTRPTFQDDTLRIVVCATDMEANQRASVHFMQLKGVAQMLAFTDKAVYALNDLTKKSPNRRVVCIANYYDAHKTLVVANGVMGTLEDDGSIRYDNGFHDTLKRGKITSKYVPGRASNVNKAQGNEFACPGIIVASTWRTDVIPRELIYTAISRFKEKVVIYGRGCVISQAFNSQFDTSDQSEIIQLFQRKLGESNKRVNI